jgi:N-acetylneuraminic acid mutarotase
MVYCNVTNEIIMYGGGSYTDTWSFDCATQTWSAVVTTINPGAHWSHAMAYDPVENAVIMFGGFSGEGREGDDSWKFDCSTRQWSELNPSTTPLARYGHVMVYDESIGQIVLANGNTAYQGHQDDTWLYDTATNVWTEVDTTGTSGRLKWPGMAYDSTNERCILFGGQVGDDPVDETMSYNAESETWTNALPDVCPESRITPAMTYDSANDVVVLFGGMDGNYDQLGDTWTYSYTANVWTDMSGEPTSTGTTTSSTDTDTPPPNGLSLDFLVLLIAPGVLVVIILVANMVRVAKNERLQS